MSNSQVKMDNYINRLVTFADWPDTITVSAVALSQAGFYYIGNSNEVRCFLCNISINQWKCADNPLIQHIHMSPMCSFAREKYREVTNKHYYNETRNSPSKNSKTKGNNHPETSKEIRNNHAENSMETGNNHGQTSIIATENATSPFYSYPNSNSGAKNILLQQNQSTKYNYAENNINPRENGQFPIKIESNSEAMNILQKQNNSFENTVIQKRTGLTQLPNNTDFTIEANRLASFTVMWPLSAPVSPQDIAAAGMYFTGPGDRVQCAWCKGGLYNWEEGDIPIEEHKRHFPKCTFLACYNREQQNKPNFKIIGKNLAEVNGISPEATSQILQETEVDKRPAEYPAMKIAKDMGFSSNLISKAADIVYKKYGSVDTDHLMDTLFELESQDLNCSDDDENEEIPQEEEVKRNISSNLTQGIQNMSLNTNSKPEDSANNDNNHELSVNGGSTNEDQISHLKEENSQLKGTTTCKICLDKPVCVLFLPCRHLVCCQECGDAVKMCPVCRTVIVGTIDTFM